MRSSNWKVHVMSIFFLIILFCVSCHFLDLEYVILYNFLLNHICVFLYTCLFLIGAEVDPGLRYKGGRLIHQYYMIKKYCIMLSSLST
jgi:hypothetical protein